MAPGAPLLLLLLLLPPPLPSSPSAPPPAMDSYSGCCTAESIRRRALNPSGCASRLERARSVERICSRISCGFRAVCSDWRIQRPPPDVLDGAAAAVRVHGGGA